MPDCGAKARTHTPVIAQSWEDDNSRKPMTKIGSLAPEKTSLRGNHLSNTTCLTLLV